jgi:carbon monoxide dehydrogenase subunit G
LIFNLGGDDCLAKLTTSIEIEASPEKVFTFLTDLKNWNDASKGTSEVEKTSEGPVGVGTTMHFVGMAGGTQTEFDMEVTEFVKNKKIAFRTIGGSKVKMTASYTYEPTAKGTKMTYNMDYELPYSILGKLLDKVKVSKDMLKNQNKTLENIKKAIEA